MAQLTYSLITFSGTNASDLLGSLSNGVNGIRFLVLGNSGLGNQRKGFSVTAMARKVKKHEYPWPNDADPNVKGVLSHLSHFKLLKEKPKPVTLQFEKPLIDLEKKIIGVRKMVQETGLDFSDQIKSLENKYRQALKDLYMHLIPIQRVNIALHPNRPTFLDHVLSITEKVGSGDTSGGSTTPNYHYCWMHPEDIDYERPVTQCNVCIDLAAEMAAALVAGSIVFKDNKAYSQELVCSARTLYDFARQIALCVQLGKCTIL